MQKKIIQIEDMSSEELKKLFYNVFMELLPEFKKALMPEDEQLLTIKETCLLLKRSRASLYNYINKQIKPFDKPIRRGSSLYFKKSEILNFRENI